MKIFLSIFICSSLVSCNSKNWADDDYVKQHNYQIVIGDESDLKISERPNEYPMYPDGNDGINKLLMENVEYPIEAQEEGIEGKVIVKYVIDTKGYVTKVRIETSVHQLLDEEAIRVVKLMERWIPAKKYGRNMEMTYRQPVRFKLE